LVSIWSAILSFPTTVVCRLKLPSKLDWIMNCY
jgi:hypothetical protein